MNANERKYLIKYSGKFNITDFADTNSASNHPFIKSPLAMTASLNNQISFICVHLRSFADIF